MKYGLRCHKSSGVKIFVLIEWFPNPQYASFPQSVTIFADFSIALRASLLFHRIHVERSEQRSAASAPVGRIDNSMTVKSSIATLAICQRSQT